MKQTRSRLAWILWHLFAVIRLRLTSFYKYSGQKMKGDRSALIHALFVFLLGCFETERAGSTVGVGTVFQGIDSNVCLP